MFLALLVLLVKSSFFIICELSNREKDMLVQIRKLIHSPPVEAWIYRDQYSTLQSMLISDKILDKGLVNDGKNTKAAIENQLMRAMQGDDVNVYIFGEGVSMGVELEDLDFVYHYALAMWWNHTIGTVTGSFMKTRTISVRGIMTKYMSKCWQEYLDDQETFDLAILELNANDRNDGELGLSLEYFLRSISSAFDNRIDVLMAVFYSTAYFDEDRYNTTLEMSENIVANLSEYYNLTTINIENFFNASIFKNETFLKKKIFHRKQPTALAHAQMAISLMRYYTSVVRETIDKWMEKDTIERTITTPPLPQFKNLAKNASLSGVCWTATLVDVNEYGKLKHTLFSLPANGTKEVTAVMETDGKHKWRDSLGGYRIKEDGKVSIKITVPSYLNVTHCPVALANVLTKQSNEAKIYVWGGNSSIEIDTYIFGAGRTATQYVDEIASLHPGQWWVTIYPYVGSFLLNAILIC